MIVVQIAFFVIGLVNAITLDRHAIDENCAELDLIKIIKCGRDCDTEFQNCNKKCNTFDSSCRYGCIKKDKTCSANCPCIVTKKNPEDIWSNILFDVSEDMLEDYGFKKYYSELSGAEVALKGRMMPPKNSKYVFAGCGIHNSATIKMGVIGTPNELFNMKSYAYAQDTLATPLRSFYVYYSSSKYEPFGFSGSATINLKSVDEYDLSDNTRMSAYTTFDFGVWRCGDTNNLDQNFKSTYEIVFYAV